MQQRSLANDLDRSSDELTLFSCSALVTVTKLFTKRLATTKQRPIFQDIHHRGLTFRTPRTPPQNKYQNIGETMMGTLVILPMF
eukprot:4439677-Amphidinium_carterae.1